MKEMQRDPVDFMPDISLSRIDQNKIIYGLNITDIDIKDLLILLHLTTIKLYTKLHKETSYSVFSVIEGEDNLLYYDLSYTEFIDAYPLAKMTEDEFYERINKLVNDKLIYSIYGSNYMPYYRCTKLVDEILEVF